MNKHFGIRNFTLLMISLLFFQLTTPSAVASGKTIKVGVYQNTPLSFIEENGEVKGFFIDILEYIAAKEGWEIEYVPSSFSECLSNLKTGLIDLLGVIAYSESRGRFYNYTSESVITNWGQMYIHKKSSVESIIDLEGKKVAVLHGDIYFSNLKKLVNQFGIQCRFIEAFEYEDVMLLVELGLCEAGLVSQIYGLQYERDYDIAKSSILVSPKKLYWATAKGKNSELLYTLDRHLKKLKADEQSVYKRAIDTWFGIGAKSNFGKWIKWATFIFLFLSALFFTTNIFLRTQVKSRTKELLAKNEELINEIKIRKQAEDGLKKSEEKLARSKRMESLGLLAGGVAHDLNNVLSGIVSYPELLLLDLPEDSKLREPIKTIQESGHRAAAIVQDLLTVARGVATVKEPLNLNDLIEGFLDSPEFRKFKEHYPLIKVSRNLATDLLNIPASQVHIRKVVMNLTSNALEAIDGHGNISIATINRYVDRPLKGYEDVNIGEYVVFSISDDGPGISSDDRERIFEPFYTKKVMGRSGTGLGLAVVWNVVQSHQGYINVVSDENGTTFELYFPITRERTPDKDFDIPIADFRGTGETILVIDDVKSQREISCSMLNRLGYTASSVASGEEAVEYLREHTVDLVLLDMIMDPGINGLKTYQKVIKIHPNQRAIIVSGFAETDDVREAQKLGAGKYIKKPLTLEKLGLSLKKELER